MTTPLTDEQILTLINTVEPIEDWERLIPGALDNPGRYPDADWLESHFGVMLDNLTSRLVAAARWENGGAVDPDTVRGHWSYGKRRYGTKDNHIADQAVGSGILTWKDPRFSRGGRIPAHVASVLLRLDQAVGERMGYTVEFDDDELYVSGEIITIPDASTPEGRADDLRDGVLPTAKEIELARDFDYCRRRNNPPSFEWLTLLCCHPDVHDRIAKCEVKQ